MKKVFITGANGHVGANTVRALLDMGYTVKAMVRKTSDLRGLQKLDITYAYGDVLDKQSLIEGAKGCEVILHLAANFKLFAKTVEEIMAPAVEGTKNIFEAAAANSIQRVVYTSSFMAVGTVPEPAQVLTTNDWIPDDTRDIYALAKRDSEQIAWKLSEKYGIPLIALLPGTILGRYDYQVTPSNRVIKDMLTGVGLTLNMHLPYVDVRDVALIHAQAVAQGEPGNRYFILSSAFPMKEMSAIFTNITGRKVPHLPSSRQMDIWSGRMMETIGRLTGWTPPLTRAMAEYFSHRYANMDNSATISTFGYRPTPLEKTVFDAVNWFHFLGIGKVDQKQAGKLIPEPAWAK